jgi:iron complex transport system ATP-binding protein
MSALLCYERAALEMAGRSVLADFSVAVGAGEIVALLGPNGAGKTSVLRAGLGLVPLASGAVRLGEDDPRTLSARERALRAAYLPQHPQAIWPLSVEALVSLGRYAHGGAPDRLGPRDQAAVDAAIETCGLGGLRARRMDEISGGEKLRVHLARTLAQEAPLLMLDEPSAGLDPAQALGVAEILQAHAKRGGAVLFSTHDVALAAHAAHRVAVMAQGRLLAEGAPEAALTPEVLEQAYGKRGRLERVGSGYAAVFEAQSLNRPA